MIHLLTGDCVEVMAGLEPASVDAIVTDPPYGLGFMGKAWDTEIPHDAWPECLRVLKPGGHMLVAGIGRTHHRMMVAVEDAGFEVRDVLMHLFGSGFPKSLDVSKAIDKAAGAEREVIGHRTHGIGSYAQGTSVRQGFRPYTNGMPSENNGGISDITSPTTPDAQCWDGYGTALKPAWEVWALFRKPLIGTVAQNVLAHGVGGLNIDGCRVAAPGADRGGWWDAPGVASVGGIMNGVGPMHEQATPSSAGRWPPNLLLSHLPECERVGTRRVRGNGRDGSPRAGGFGDVGANNGDGRTSAENPYADPDGLETIDAWDCAPGCAVAELGRQSGATSVTGARTERSRTATVDGTAWGTSNHRSTEYPADTGTAARFFPQFQVEPEPPWLYMAKAGRAERNAGVEGAEEKPLNWSNGAQSPGTFQAEGTHRAARNNHPTVKPIGLMRWLCRLVTPPGGLILDPFMGSGTTGIAAAQEGFEFIGVEREADYMAIAEARIKHWASLATQRGLF